MSTQEYKQLSRAVANLEKELMDFRPRQADEYLRSELLKCQAFVVFAHAEIEVYFESIATRILNYAEKFWKKDGKIGRVVASLIAFRTSEKTYIPDCPNAVTKNSNLRLIIDDAFAKHRENIGKKNGIKRANITKLLWPVGLFDDHFSEVFLIQLDQTGKRRGEMVHKSSRVSLSTIGDPFADEKETINKLLEEIKDFDQKLRVEGLLR